MRSSLAADLLRKPLSLAGGGFSFGSALILPHPEVCIHQLPIIPKPVGRRVYGPVPSQVRGFLFSNALPPNVGSDRACKVAGDG